MKKECIKCNVVKDLEEFHIQKKGKFGRHSYCRECKNEINRNIHKKNRVKEMECSKNYYYNNKEKMQKASKEWINKNKERRKKHSIKSYYNNKIRKQINAITRYALKKGIIKRKDKCEWCDSSKNIQMHHEDYLKPLNIIFLCSSCHAKRHVELKSKIKEVGSE